VGCKMKRPQLHRRCTALSVGRLRRAAVEDDNNKEEEPGEGSRRQW